MEVDILFEFEYKNTCLSGVVYELIGTCMSLLVDDPLQAKLFLFPPLIDMADQRPPQTTKDSKKFLNRLKKVFGPGSQSTPAIVASPPTVAAPPADPLPPADLAADPEEAAKLRAKYTHFRILVIGRANAGKTTLLKRVCNTKEDPVYSKVRYKFT